MADQIVIELIGDPSGLKPAEEALKELSKISEENMAAFNKANESMKKFQEGLTEAGKKAGEAAEAAKKLGEAMKDIGDKAEGAGKAAKAFDDIGKSATKSITAISALNGVIAGGAIKEVAKDTKDWSAKIEELTKKKEVLIEKLAKEKVKLAELAEEVGTSSKKYKELSDAHQITIGSLGGTTSALNNAMEAQKLQNKATEDSEGFVSRLVGKMKALFSVQDESGKSTEKSASKFKLLDVSVNDSDRNLAGLLSHTKEMVSALGEVGEAAAHAAGNEDAANAIKKNTAAAMQAIAIAQSVVTVATEAATIANLALDAAMLPIIATAAAIAAGVAILAGNFYIVYKGTQALMEGLNKIFPIFKLFNGLVSSAKETLSEWGDKIRNVASMLSGGLIDNTELKKTKEDLEKMVKTADDHTEALKRSVALLEAQGASEEDIAAKKIKQLESDRESLENQKKLAELNHDSVKLKELEAKIDEDDLGIIKLQTEATKAKNKAIDDAKAEKEKEAAADREAYAQWLSNAKTLADEKLAITKAGSKAELDARIADINAATAIEINNAKGNQEMIKAIREKNKQDIAAANRVYTAAEIEDHKTGLQVMLGDEKATDAQKLELKKKILDDERQLALNQANLTDNQIALINQEFANKCKELDKEVEEKRKAALQIRIQAIRDSDLIELNSHIEMEKDKLQHMDQWSKEATQLKKDMLADQQQIAIDEANNSIADEGVRQKKIEQIKNQFAREFKKIDDDVNDHEKANAEALAKAKEAMEKKAATTAINLGKQVADAIFAAAAEKRQANLDAAISTMETQKAAELSNHHLTAAQKAAVEKKYHAEEAAIKLKAWKSDQKAKAEQAIINGLLAVTSALATVQPTLPDGIIAGALALATSGIAVAQILSKSPPKFAKGVIGLHGPGTETSDSIPAYLSRGESVITAERTRQYKPVLEQIQAGSFQPLPIPMLSSLPRLNDLSGVQGMSPGQGRAAAIDYDKLGQAVARALPKAKVQKLSFDKKGFSHYIISENGRLESYNNRYRD